MFLDISKAFDISKKTPLTLNLLSNVIYFMSNYLTQESSGLSSDWLGETNLLAAKIVNSSL